MLDAASVHKFQLKMQDTTVSEKSKGKKSGFCEEI
jgi:hypothetical protein